MKPLEEQMSIYGAYHRDLRNRLTHFVGVPIIVFAILQALSWLRVDVAGYTVTAAMPFVFVILIYYFRLDAALGAAMTVFTLAVLYFADAAAVQSWPTSLAIFLVTFVGGWIIQLIGHYFEGRKPALADNLFQVFVAPVFLMAELFFALGWKPQLRDRVERLVEARMGERKAKSPAALA